MSGASPLPMGTLPCRMAGAGTPGDHLTGVRVVDLTTSVAGPYGTMLLADLGAEVIKIERPGAGDDARAWGPPFLEGESLWFLAMNRGKQSVTLDITRPEGRAVLEDLVRAADVVVTNQPASVQAKLGTDAATLGALNDRLIHASITGFGLTGARAHLTCYDLVAEGHSGIMDLTGAAGGEPQKVGAPAADMLAGQDAAMAVMAALLRRPRATGPQVIDIALVDSMTRFLACRMTPYLGSGEVPSRSGGTDSVIAIYQTFRTADRPITLGLGTDGIWRRFWQAVGRPERAEAPGEGSNAERRARREAIAGEIQSELLTRTAAQWLEAFAAARVPAGPINTVAEAGADPALQARGMVHVLSDGVREVPQVGLGIRFGDGAAGAAGEVTARTLPPRLGQHTRAVLSGVLGHSADHIDRLAEARII